MMKEHRTSRLRSFGGAAALVVIAGAGLSLAAPTLAHPHPEGERKEQRIIIMEQKGGDAQRDRTHSFRIRRGENGELVLPERCQNGEPIANVDERTGDQRTRVILCTSGEADAATRLQRLQQARERIAANDELTGEHRERVLGALDRAIAQQRTGQ